MQFEAGPLYIVANNTNTRKPKSIIRKKKVEKDCTAPVTTSQALLQINVHGCMSIVMSRNRKPKFPTTYRQMPRNVNKRYPNPTLSYHLLQPVHKSSNSTSSKGTLEYGYVPTKSTSFQVASVKGPVKRRKGGDTRCCTSPSSPSSPRHSCPGTNRCALSVALSRGIPRTSAAPGLRLRGAHCLPNRDGFRPWSHLLRRLLSRIVVVCCSCRWEFTCIISCTTSERRGSQLPAKDEAFVIHHLLSRRK